jgi:formylglycine-generating enzyme
VPVVPDEPLAPEVSSAAPAASASAPTTPARPTTGLPAVDRALERTGSSCPEGMILVDGDYCSEVERRCLKQWYAKSNKKDICEEYAESARCVGKKTKKRFCIDTFAWPNVVGERPEVMNNFYQAMVKCAAVGKRMCTETEWSFACEGPDMKPFPYGYKRDPHKCNGDQPWDDPQVGRSDKLDPAEMARLWKGVRNGAQPECISDFGVPDLPGNTDDVVANDSYRKGGIYANYESVNTGGPWYKGVRNACRPKVYSHNEGFAYYYLGFRCCAEADGRETDPRTPRMVESRQSFEKVERLARFTVAEMKKKLELKAEGKCECSDTDRLCKIMCGKALPETAVDADLAAPR